jgi:nitrile hydratase
VAAHPVEPGASAGSGAGAVVDAAALDLRVRALESLLVEKGLLGARTVDDIVAAYDHDVGPLLGARLAARAWLDAGFRERLIADANAACRELGVPTAATPEAEERSLAVAVNGPGVHHVVVCTLCSCYPWEVMGLPPSWYKSNAYRSQVVVAPRRVLADDFGFVLDDDVEIHVHDSTAELRWFVLPQRPAGTEHLTEDELVALVTRDGLIGTAAV